MRHYFARFKYVNKSYRWNQLYAISSISLISGHTHWTWVTYLHNSTAVSQNMYIEDSIELKLFTRVRKWEI